METGFSPTPTRCLSAEGSTFCERQLVFSIVFLFRAAVFLSGCPRQPENSICVYYFSTWRKEEGCREQMHCNLLTLVTLPRERVPFLPHFGSKIVKICENVNRELYDKRVSVLSRRIRIQMNFVQALQLETRGRTCGTLSSPMHKSKPCHSVASIT